MDDSQANQNSSIVGAETSHNQIDVELREGIEKLDLNDLKDNQISQKEEFLNKLQEDGQLDKNTLLKLKLIEIMYKKLKENIMLKHIKTDSYPNQIIPRLYLGSIGAACSKNILNELGVTHILTAMDQIESNIGEGFNHKFLQVKDSISQNLIKYFLETNKFIHEALQDENNKVLVHCFAGISRSSTFVCAYLIQYHKMTRDQAVELLKSKRPKVQPNINFMMQLKKFEQIVLKNEDKNQSNQQIQDGSNNQEQTNCEKEIVSQKEIINEQQQQINEKEDSETQQISKQHHQELRNSDESDQLAQQEIILKQENSSIEIDKSQKQENYENSESRQNQENQSVRQLSEEEQNQSNDNQLEQQNSESLLSEQREQDQQKQQEQQEQHQQEKQQEQQQQLEQQQQQQQFEQQQQQELQESRQKDKNKSNEEQDSIDQNQTQQKQNIQSDQNEVQNNESQQNNSENQLQKVEEKMQVNENLVSHENNNSEHNLLQNDQKDDQKEKSYEIIDGHQEEQTQIENKNQDNQ